MKVGTRVIVTAKGSNFLGARGVVTQVLPYITVLLDDERLAMRFDNVVEESFEPEHTLTGAE